MIFQHTIDKVLDGSKTCTSRLGEECRYRVGHTYAVQRGRGQRGEARILVTRINRQLASQITRATAQAEGFANEAEFLATWTAKHGLKNYHQPVWRIHFQLVHPSNQSRELSTMNHTRKGRRPYFEIYEDAQGEWRWRLLARNGRIIADSGEGYKTERGCRRGAANVAALAAEAQGGVL